MSQLEAPPNRTDLVDSRSNLDDNQRAILKKITLKQRDALRLTLTRKSSKEIARELGIAPRSVDQRLDAARIILGASDRGEAARKFYALIRASEGLTSDPFLIGESSSGQSSDRDEQSLYMIGDALTFQSPAKWENGSEASQDRWWRFVPELPSAASGLRDRIAWIVIGAIAILALVLLGLGVVEGLKGLIDRG